MKKKLLPDYIGSFLLKIRKDKDMDTALWIQEEYIMELIVVAFFMVGFIPIAIIEHFENRKKLQQECVRAKKLVEIENMRRERRIIQASNMKKGA